MIEEKERFETNAKYYQFKKSERAQRVAEFRK